jgi:hypothetical protein
MSKKYILGRIPMHIMLLPSLFQQKLEKMPKMSFKPDLRHGRANMPIVSKIKTFPLEQFMHRLPERQSLR